MSKERLEKKKESTISKTDKNLKLFLGLVKKGEIIYMNDGLYRKLKLTNRYKMLGSKNTCGHIQLTKTINGKEYSCLAHRIIYALYHGLDEFPKGMHINHINGVKDDNRIENLELVTPSRNLEHAYEINAKKRMSGENNPISKLTNRDVFRIKKMLSNGTPIKEIAKEFNVHSQTIYEIKRGKSWNTVHFIESQALQNK